MSESARTLRDAYNAADPAVPLPSGDPRYVDCTDVRGNRDVVQQMLKTITWSDSNTAQLLTGHRGCGKSTELLRLRARLEEAGYAVIYFEADEDLDVNDIVYSDLLLAIARRIEGELREVHDIRLDPRLLENIQRWFAEVLYTEDGWRQVERELAAEVALGVGLPEGVPLLARLREMLARRMDLEALFTGEAVDHLCRACGGHPRDLMRLVTYACIHAPRDRWPRPIDLEVAQRAEAELVEEYSRLIPEDHYPKLGRVHLPHVVENDADHQLMLYNLSVLEYLNGPPPWHDVHPAVRRLPKFQEALEREREEMGLA